MGYLLDIAIKVQTSKGKSNTSYYELNELNEVSPIVANNAPPAEQIAADQNVVPSLDETITPLANKNTSLSTEFQDLIDWFITAPRIKKPFQLDQHRRVCMPEKFYDSLLHEIQSGASCPRNRNGAVIDDLRKLKIVMDGHNTD